MAVIVFELKDGDRYRGIRNIHKVRNADGASSITSRLCCIDRCFLEVNPKDLDDTQAERVESICGTRNKDGLLVDTLLNKIVTPEEAEE